MNDRKSFWSSLPGILTGAATLIGAVVAAIVALHNLSTPQQPTSQPNTAIQPQPAPKPAPSQPTPMPAAPKEPGISSQPPQSQPPPVSGNFGATTTLLPAPRYEPGASNLVPQHMMAKGIDVSFFNKDIDWQIVSNEGYAFAVVKATEGIAYIDPLFKTNWESLQKIRMIRGAYHFFRPSEDAAEQAEFFLAHVHLEPGDLPPILDLESTNGIDPQDIVFRMSAWLSIVEARTGRKPIIYVIPSLVQTIFPKMTALKAYPLWVAFYSQADQPKLPTNWSTWTLWQFTGGGRVEGIKGTVDLNYFNGTPFELRRFTGVGNP
jgi:GH25 family lysozyme M1 (1,4-beta-N-acetylmuramidase)